MRGLSGFRDGVGTVPPIVVPLECGMMFFFDEKRVPCVKGMNFNKAPSWSILIRYASSDHSRRVFESSLEVDALENGTCLAIIIKEPLTLLYTVYFKRFVVNFRVEKFPLYFRME
jgi:hypothetical protein